eukprot:403359788
MIKTINPLGSLNSLCKRQQLNLRAYKATRIWVEIYKITGNVTLKDTKNAQQVRHAVERKKLKIVGSVFHQQMKCAVQMEYVYVYITHIAICE